MSRRYAFNRLRWALCARALIALFLLPTMAPNAVAGVDTLAATTSWPTPEGRAHEAARRAAGKAYADCVRTGIGDQSLSLSDARGQCTNEASAYAQYLPADKVDAALEFVANRLTTTR